MKTDRNSNPLKAQPCSFKDLVIEDGRIFCKVCDQTVNANWIHNEQKALIEEPAKLEF